MCYHTGIALTDSSDSFYLSVGLFACLPDYLSLCLSVHLFYVVFVGGGYYSRIPLVADPTKEISADYGVLIPSLGIALRGLFIINPHGVLEQVGEQRRVI